MQRDSKDILTARHSLAFCIALPVVASLLVNGIIFGFGFDSGGRGEAPLAGTFPGWAIAAIWLALFIALGAAWWDVARHIRQTKSDRRSAQLWLLILLLFCLCYPLYTWGFTSRPMLLFGNLVSIPLAAFAAWRVSRVSKAAALSPLAVSLWVIVATVLMFAG